MRDSIPNHHTNSASRSSPTQSNRCYGHLNKPCVLSLFLFLQTIEVFVESLPTNDEIIVRLSMPCLYVLCLCTAVIQLLLISVSVRPSPSPTNDGNNNISFALSRRSPAPTRHLLARRVCFKRSLFY